MDKRDEHQVFIEDLAINMLDVLMRHEDYYNMALGFDMSLELSDGRVFSITLTEGIYGEE